MGGKGTHSSTEETVGLVLVLLQAFGALLPAEVDATLEGATDQGAGGVPVTLFWFNKVAVR